MLALADRPSGLATDIVLAGPGLEDEFLARAIVVEVGGTPSPVISPEDLIVTKILAGRAKDIDDARGVLAERGDRLDVPYVRMTLRLVEEALGQSDLLPSFETELLLWRRGGSRAE